MLGRPYCQVFAIMDSGLTDFDINIKEALLVYIKSHRPWLNKKNTKYIARVPPLCLIYFELVIYCIKTHFTFSL